MHRGDKRRGTETWTGITIPWVKSSGLSGRKGVSGQARRTDNSPRVRARGSTLAANVDIRRLVARPVDGWSQALWISQNIQQVQVAKKWKVVVKRSRVVSQQR